MKQYLILFLLPFILTACSPASQDIESNQREELNSQADQSKFKQIEGLKLKGRGRSDEDNWREPRYEGIIGYVAVTDIAFIGSEKFPQSPWYVHQVKQVGDNLYKPTNIKIKHKTKIKVIKQSIKHRRYGMYEGVLLVQTVEGIRKEFLVDVKNFVSYDYWNDSLVEAVSQGPLIVNYNGKGKKPVDSSKEWIDIEKDCRIYTKGRARSDSDRDIEGEVFRRWKYGFGGVAVQFDKDSLDIVY